MKNNSITLTEKAKTQASILKSVAAITKKKSSAISNVGKTTQNSQQAIVNLEFSDKTVDNKIEEFGLENPHSNSKYQVSSQLDTAPSRGAVNVQPSI